MEENSSSHHTTAIGCEEMENAPAVPPIVIQPSFLTCEEGDEISIKEDNYFLIDKDESMNVDSYNIHLSMKEETFRKDQSKFYFENFQTMEEGMIKQENNVIFETDSTGIKETKPEEEANMSVQTIRRVEQTVVKEEIMLGITNDKTLSEEEEQELSLRDANDMAGYAEGDNMSVVKDLIAEEHSYACPPCKRWTVDPTRTNIGDVDHCINDPPQDERRESNPDIACKSWHGMALKKCSVVVEDIGKMCDGMTVIEYNLFAQRCLKDKLAHPKVPRVKNPKEIPQIKHKCEECGCLCSGESNFLEHKQVHFGKTNHKCQICGAGFSMRGSLAAHMKIHEQKKYKCDECNFSSERQICLKKHKLTHSVGKPFKCDDCDYSCKYPHLLKLHNIKFCHSGVKPYTMKTVHNELIKCDECEYSCRYPSRLKIHKLIHSEEKPFKCNECDSSFLRKGHLKNHMVIHSGEKVFKCNKCDYATVRKDSLKLHKLTHSAEKRYKCDECDFSCRQSTNLEVHKLTHSAEKPFKCNECDYSCVRKVYLKKHKLTHIAENPYKCDKCYYSCGSPDTLMNHKLKNHKLTHSVEKPFKCKECDSSFLRKGHLKNHMVIHSGEKVFKCNECDFLFLSKAHLTNHEASHSEGKRFNCDECDYYFTDPSTLNSHKEIHHNNKHYKCEECGCLCSGESNFLEHKQVHFGKTNHKCQICGAGFSMRGSLAAHMKIHEKKKYKCDECNFSSDRWSNVKMHCKSSLHERLFIRH